MLSTVERTCASSSARPRASFPRFKYLIMIIAMRLIYKYDFVQK
jgi:hypothetical protein